MSSLSNRVIVLLCMSKYLMDFKLFLHTLFLLHLLSSLWMLMMKRCQKPAGLKYLAEAVCFPGILVLI